MLKPVISDNRIWQLSAITIVPSVADIFFDLAGSFNNCPTAFAVIGDKILDADIGLFVVKIQPF